MVLGGPQQSDNGSPSANAEGVELAQAAGGSEPVGQVSAVQGAVFITHADGTKVPAPDGTPIFQGDLVETGATGSIGVTFADDTTFSLADEGRMVIEEMVYDPATQFGKSAIDITQEVFR